jgi:hypothetical protein
MRVVAGPGLHPLGGRWRLHINCCREPNFRGLCPAKPRII